MARKAAPPNSGPAYVSKTALRRPLADPDESVFARFLRTEIFAPEKRQGNLSIVRGMALFAGAVTVARLWGDLMVPA